MKTRHLIFLLLVETALAAPDWETWVRSDGSIFEARVRQAAPGLVTFELRAGGEQNLAPGQLAERSRRRLAEVLGLVSSTTPVAAAASVVTPAADALQAADTGALEARFGQAAVVTGRVQRVATLGASGHRLLEFEGGAFRVFIHRRDLEKHPAWPLDSLTGRRVSVQGGIGKYQERLQIQVSEPARSTALE